MEYGFTADGFGKRGSSQGISRWPVSTSGMIQEDRLRSEFLSVFEKADYPVNGVMELAGALHKGPLTKFETRRLLVIRTA